MKVPSAASSGGGLDGLGVNVGAFRARSAFVGRVVLCPAVFCLWERWVSGVLVFAGRFGGLFAFGFRIGPACIGGGSGL